MQGVPITWMAFAVGLSPGDKAKEPSVTRVPLRWGPLMGTWHGGPSVMQMGFEGQRWSLR